MRFGSLFQLLPKFPRALVRYETVRYFTERLLDRLLVGRNESADARTVVADAYERRTRKQPERTSPPPGAEP